MIFSWRWCLFKLSRVFESGNIRFSQPVKVRMMFLFKRNWGNKNFAKLKEVKFAAELHWICRGQCSIRVLSSLATRRCCGLIADAIRSRDFLSAFHRRSLLQLFFTLSSSTNYLSKQCISDFALSFTNKPYGCDCTGDVAIAALVA